MNHILRELSRATKKQLHKTSVLPESKGKRERGGGKEEGAPKEERKYSKKKEKLENEMK